MNEPRWRTALCWGAVITFLTLPLLVFILHLISDEVTWFHFSEHLAEYKFLTPYFQTVTGLVLGLAGLNSFDKHSANSRGDQKGS